MIDQATRWLAARNWRSVRRRARTLLVFGTTLGGLTLALLSLGSQATRAQRSAANASVLRSVDVEESSSGVGLTLLTPAHVVTMKSVSHVSAVQPVVTTSIGIKQKPIMGVLLNATTPRQVGLPPIVSSTRTTVFPLHRGEIVLPTAAQHQDLRPLLGQEVSITLTPNEGGHGGFAQSSARVVTLYDASWEYDGPDSAYADDQSLVEWAAANAGLVPAQFLEQNGYSAAIATVDSSGNVSSVLGALQKQGYYARSLLQAESNLPSTFQLIRYASLLAGFLLVALVLIGSSLLMNAMTRQRVREFALLRAVGYQRVDVFGLVMLEGASLGLAVAFGCVVAGSVTANVAEVALRHVHSLHGYLVHGLLLPTGTVAVAAFVSLVGMVIVGTLPAALRAARLEPADGLRDFA